MNHKIIDLFCGCGGFSLGFINAGYDVLFALDFDSSAVMSYKLNFPKTHVLCADITQIHLEPTIEQYIKANLVDVVIGGPPCRDLLIENSQLKHCAANKLFLAFSNFISITKPTCFVIENIPDVLTNGNHAGNAIINHFENLGYSTNCFLLNAFDYGVPQRKQRAIFLGVNGIANPVKFTEFMSKAVSCDEAISDLPVPSKNVASLRYRFPAQNAFQRQMRGKQEIVEDQYSLSESKALLIKRKVEERTLRRGELAPDIDTRPKHRDQLHYEQDRLLTIREFARLQTFPDSYKFFGTNEEKVRQVGNAIPPLLAQGIAQQIRDYLVQGTK